MILQEAYVEADQVVVQELVITQSFKILTVNFSLLLAETRVYKWPIKSINPAKQ
jgi:hypothetical protein